MTPWAIVAGDFTPLGGMDRANHALASYLACQRVVHLVAHRVWPDLLSNANVRIHMVRRPFGRHALGRPLLAQTGARVLRDVLSRGGRAVANGSNSLSSDLNWVHFVHAAHEKSVRTQGRYPLISGGLRWLAARREVERERRRLGASRLIVCNSQMTANDLVEHVGVDPRRVSVVFLSCDLLEFKPLDAGRTREARHALGLDGRPAVAFIGESLSRRKGFDVLYRAWQMLVRGGGWDPVLLVVGAARRPRLDRRVKLDGMGQHIRILGHRRDVSSIMSAADLVVLPSRYEPYGLAAHEAICVGTPAVVSRRSGIAERFPPDLADLILEDPDDAVELADRLRSWRLTADSWRARVRPLAEVLRAWTWDDMSRQIVNLAGEIV